MSKVETILEEIKGLTLLEASDLVRRWKKPSASLRRRPRSGGGGGAAAGGAAPAEEKTEFTVVLRTLAATKSTLLKPSAKSPAGLEEAKDLVTALRRLSRKASTRTRPRRSRRSSKRPAPVEIK